MPVVEQRRDVGGWAVRWNAALAAQARANGDWPDRTVADFARERAAQHPEQVQIVDGDRSLSCAELFERARRLAGWFLAIGLKPGEVVSFQLPNWWEACVIDLAASMTGVVTNPIVPINRDAEVRYMLQESRTRVMFVPSTFRKFDHAAMMQRIAADLPDRPRVVLVRGQGMHGEADFDTLLAASSPVSRFVAVDPDAVKLLMYTSGTTGRPKGVLHSHNSFHADSVKLKPTVGLGKGDVTFCPSPVTHVSGYLWVLNMPWCGDIPAVMVDTWEPERAFELMRRHACSFMVGATPFLQDLVAEARRRGETLPALRSYLCGGAAVPPSLIYEAAELFPNCLPWRTFGATEAPTMTGPPPSRAGLRLAAETDGRLNRAEVRIVDIVSGALLAPGEEGEILVREPSMALGYARAEDNEAAYDEDGFFRMGDLGRLVETGHLICTGRKKDLIIRAGENISAKEIEDVLHRCPKVAECAVVSMPSTRTGEAICAFVVPVPGATLDLPEIAKLVQDARMATQKTPERVVLVAELPKNPAGKVRKDLLRQTAKTFAQD